MDCIIPGRPPENADEVDWIALSGDPLTDALSPMPDAPGLEERGSGGRLVI